jgi:hypothetical protein
MAKASIARSAATLRKARQAALVERNLAEAELSEALADLDRIRSGAGSRLPREAASRLQTMVQVWMTCHVDGGNAREGQFTPYSKAAILAKVRDLVATVESAETVAYTVPAERRVAAARLRLARIDGPLQLLLHEAANPQAAGVKG